jgi:mortality factor 4-like protein 1
MAFIKCVILVVFEGVGGETESACTILPQFAVGERVLCFHGPLIYEGKPLEMEFREEASQFAYLIHYVGWSKRYE